MAKHTTFHREQFPLESKTKSDICCDIIKNISYPETEWKSIIIQIANAVIIFEGKENLLYIAAQSSDFFADILLQIFGVHPAVTFNNIANASDKLIFINGHNKIEAELKTNNASIKNNIDIIMKKINPM